MANTELRDHLRKIQDLLDELTLRVDIDEAECAYPKDEYLHSGIRTIRHEVFQAQKLVLDL